VVVGQSAYDEAYGAAFPTNYPCWGVARIQDTSMCVQPVTGQPALYLPLQPKAIHDEMGASFDDYGRMSTNLGLELPFTQVGNQNFVLQSYSDPPTELIKMSDRAVPLGDVRKDGTQIWKITHNGVDTHPVHFHLFHVQLINRVGWDGGIRLPHPTELGWKDTVRISPLEDTIVALRPIAPTPDSLPWKLPNSIRPLEPALPIGSLLGFTNLDPQGNAVTVTNQDTNFGWEYIWHCHILSHEEHDMMRAIGFAVPPEAPGPLTVQVQGNNVVLNWTDNSLVATGFMVERATDATFETNLVQTPVGMFTVFTDNPTAGDYFYRVIATNTIGTTLVPGYPTITRESEPSNVVPITFVPAPNVVLSPLTLSFGDQLVDTFSINRQVAVSNIGTSPVSLLGVTFTGPFSRNGGTCNGTLLVGRTCTINVRFRPTDIGPAVGQLSLATSDPNSPHIVALDGNGLLPIAEVTPVALSFSSPLGIPSAIQTVTVTNTGNTPLTINNVTRTGTHSGQFTHQNLCPASLGVGLSCTINVTFAPTTASPLNKVANLNVVTAAPAANAVVPLTGAIVVPTFTISPSPLAFGNMSVAGGNAVIPVTITNTSTAPLRIISITRTGQTAQFPAPQNVNCPISPATLAPGASCQVNALFNPTTAGLKTGNFVVNVGPPGTNQSVPMTGNGILP
jgi:hypothetical protein